MKILNFMQTFITKEVNHADAKIKREAFRACLTKLSYIRKKAKNGNE